MKKIEHIGIAVKDLEQAKSRFTKLLNKQPYKMEQVDSEHVQTLFFELDGVKIELLQATSPDSPIAKFIEKRGEGIHHIAFDTTDIGKTLTHLTQQGFEKINATPKSGADNKDIAFLHPKSTHGVLVELCQDKS